MVEVFRAEIRSTGKTAAGIPVPPEVVERLGTSRRPPVKVTIGRHTYRSTVAVMGGEYLVGVSNENRRLAGVQAGDVVDVRLELDTEPREVAVPQDLAAALAADPTAAAAFERLSYSNRLRHVLGVEGAKTAETRQRRIAQTVATLGGRGT
jgi:hypothetical protein